MIRYSKLDSIALWEEPIQEGLSPYLKKIKEIKNGFRIKFVLCCRKNIIKQTMVGIMDKYRPLLAPCALIMSLETTTDVLSRDANNLTTSPTQNVPLKSTTSSNMAAIREKYIFCLLEWVPLPKIGYKIWFNDDQFFTYFDSCTLVLIIFPIHSTTKTQIETIPWPQTPLNDRHYSIQGASIKNNPLSLSLTNCYCPSSSSWYKIDTHRPTKQRAMYPSLCIQHPFEQTHPISLLFTIKRLPSFSLSLQSIHEEIPYRRDKLLNWLELHWQTRSK